MANSDRNAQATEKILFYCEKIETAVSRFGNTLEAFQADFDYRSVCAMYIMQIGELSTVLTDDFRAKYSGVPWRLIRGMRNVFAHDYHNMNVEETWNTIQTNIPELKSYCEVILRLEKLVNSD